MPTTKSGKRTWRSKNSETSSSDSSEAESSNFNDSRTNKGSFSVPQLRKCSGSITENAYRIFILFDYLAILQGWTPENKEILPDVSTRNNSGFNVPAANTNQLSNITYDQLKAKLLG